MDTANGSGKMVKTSGYALVKDSVVTVMVAKELREVFAAATLANRYSPIARTRVARCTYVYEGMGVVSNVKVGRFV